MKKSYTFNEVLNTLSDKRKEHTLGVIETAEELAEKYNADIDKVKTAALFHDIFRGKTLKYINELISEYNLPEKYIDNANLAHGKLAAYYVENEIGITDKDIINAISFHTTGRRGMSIIEKIVFIADAIEPGRDYPHVDEIRKIAFTDIDKACLLSLENTISHLMNQGMSYDEIDVDTREALDCFKEGEK